MYNNKVNKGKKLVLSIILIINLYYWVSFFTSLDMQNIQIQLKQISVLLTISFISFLFYKGFKIDEGFVYIFLIYPVFTITFYLLRLIGVLELYNGWLMVAVTAMIAIIGGILIVNQNSISEFMKYQRSRRKWFNKY